MSGGAVSSQTDPAGSRRVLSVLGWTGVVVLLVLIAVLTAVLSGMLLVVSIWLSVAVPLVVLMSVIGLAAYARRAG